MKEKKDGANTFLDKKDDRAKTFLQKNNDGAESFSDIDAFFWSRQWSVNGQWLSL